MSYGTGRRTEEPLGRGNLQRRKGLQTRAGKKIRIALRHPSPALSVVNKVTPSGNGIRVSRKATAVRRARVHLAPGLKVKAQEPAKRRPELRANNPQRLQRRERE